MEWFHKIVHKSRSWKRLIIPLRRTQEAWDKDKVCKLNQGWRSNLWRIYNWILSFLFSQTNGKLGNSFGVNSKRKHTDIQIHLDSKEYIVLCPFTQILSKCFIFSLTLIVLLDMLVCLNLVMFLSSFIPPKKVSLPWSSKSFISLNKLLVVQMQGNAKRIMTILNKCSHTHRCNKPKI